MKQIKNLKFSKEPWFKFGITVLITTVIVGGVVYCLMQEKIRKENNRTEAIRRINMNLDSKIDELENEIVNLEQQIINFNKKINYLENLSKNKKGEYKNEKYGFQFKYPEELVISNISTDDSFGLSDRPDGYGFLGIRVSENTDNLPLKQIFENFITRYEKEERQIIVSDINVGGVPAKRFYVKNYNDRGNAGAVLVHGNDVITIYGDDSNENLKEIFERVINSLEFTE